MRLTSPTREQIASNVHLHLLSPPHSKTLPPRGVCSRIPHLRLSRRDSHGLFLAHVYARIIPYFISIPSGGRSVLPTFWNIWYNCLIKLNALLVRPREYLYIPKDNGLRAGCGNVFCRVPFVGCCPAVEGHARTFCIGLRGFFLPRQNACEVKNDRPDEARHNNPLHGPLRRSCERGDSRDFDTLIPDFS